MKFSEILTLLQILNESQYFQVFRNPRYEDDKKLYIEPNNFQNQPCIAPKYNPQHVRKQYVPQHVRKQYIPQHVRKQYKPTNVLRRQYAPVPYGYIPKQHLLPAPLYDFKVYNNPQIYPSKYYKFPRYKKYSKTPKYKKYFKIPKKLVYDYIPHLPNKKSAYSKSSLPKKKPVYDLISNPNWNLVNKEVCGSSLSDRIIGGINATLGQYPWIARIAYAYKNNKSVEKYNCGGTLINERYIVTAAHCVTKLNVGESVTKIRLGEYNTETEPDCDEDNECADPVQDFSPEKIIPHVKYQSPAFRNDIALIRLNRPAKFTRWVTPICLPNGILLDKNFVNSTGEVAGWGYFEIAQSITSTILQTVTLPIIETERCQKANRRIALSQLDQLCVGGEVGKDSCNGDSGGPLMKVQVLSDIPRYYLLGVVSFGPKYCGLTTAPAIYTKVASYLNWILNNIKK